MANFDSTKIKVFPSTRRTKPYSRLMSEQGITGIIKHLSLDGKGTFIITDSEKFAAGGPFEICIDGYYFQIDRTTFSNLIVDSNSQVYVWINDISKTTSGDYDGFEELVGQDSSSGGSSSYTGLNYSTTKPADWDENENPPSGTYGMKVVHNGAINDNLSLFAIISKYITPIVIAHRVESSTIEPAEQVLDSQLWIDIDGGGIARYKSNNAWVGLGAVYKEAT